MNAIEVKNLQKYFKETKAVDDISFSVEQGEIFGFLGPNGAGKTTTIRTMMDFIRPTSGSITILGKDSHRDSTELKAIIGFLSGYVHLYNHWTGEEHIKYVQKLNGITDWPHNLIERFNFDTSIKSKQLSSGNRQKLGIILCFMKKPKILIMDEPTNALDPLLQIEVYELLEEEAKKGTTIFMSSHNLTEVDRVCNRVGIIKEGKMVATESISTLKEKKINTVHAYFSEPIDPKTILGENMELVKQAGNTLIINVKGDINPLMKKLAQHNLRDIDISQASMEDIFLEFYGITNNHKED